ncbi:MAG: carbohydrate-binding family 9-like protein, partial [Armatimonadota bacterium]
VQKKTLSNLPGPRLICGKTSLPPVIDGRLSDDCWKECVEAGNFLLMGGRGLAREQTKCRLAYDDKYLYISFLCLERVLDPVLNLMDMFKAQVKIRDSSKIFRDDCVEFFLSPGEGGADYYHIAANSLGTIYDCRGMGNPSTWSAAGIKAQGALSKGQWTAEIAVPFTEIGAPAPRPGDIWRMNLCRTEQPAKEYSSWSPVSAKGFHSPEHFGYIQFADKAPAISGPDLAACKDGQYKLSVNARNTHSQPKSAALNVVVTCGEEKINYADEQKIPASAQSDLNLNFTINSNNRCLKLEALNDATYVARTGDIQIKPGAEYQFSAMVKTIGYKFQSPAYGLFNILPRDAAGVNVNKGGYTVIASVQGYKEGWQRVSGTWKAPENAASAQFWIIAWKGHGSGKFLIDDVRLVEKSTGENIIPNPDFPKGSEFFKWPTLSKTVSASDSYGAGCYEISYFYQISMGSDLVYQSPQFTDKLEANIADIRSSFLSFVASPSMQVFNVKDVYIAEGSAERLLLALKSPFYDKLDKVNFQLEMPRYCQLVDDFADRDYISPLACREELVDRDGVPYRRYTMVFGRDAVTRADCYNHEILPIPFVIKLTGALAETSRNNIYYRAWIDEKMAETRPNILKVVNLPPLADKSPKRLPVFVWGPSEPIYRHGSPAREELISTWGQSGFNYVNTFPRLNKDFLAHGIRPFDLLPTITLGWHFPSAKAYLEKHPEHCEKDAQGNKLNAISLAHLLEENCTYRDTIKEVITRCVSAYPYQLNWDYEFGVARDNSLGFSDANIKAFRKRAGIPDSATLTPANILKDYRSQWIDFRCWQNGEFAKLYRRYIKEANPNCLFSIYSGYQSPSTAEQYGVDWRYMGTAADLVMCGYGRGPYKETAQAIGGRYFNGGELIWGGYYDQDPLENTVFQRLTDCGSVMAYIAWITDGRFSTAYSRAAAVSADFEDFFLNLKREDNLVNGVDGSSRADIAVLTYQGERLLFLFNSSPAEKKMEFINCSLPGGIIGIDYDTKNIIKNPSKISTSIQPWRVKVIYLKKPGSSNVSSVSNPSAQIDSSLKPVFRWKDAQGGANKYCLQYGEDKDFHSAVKIENISANYYQAAKEINPTGSCYWRVKAVDAISGREGAWSDTQRLVPSAKPSANTGRSAGMRMDSIDSLGYWTNGWLSTSFASTEKDYQVKREGRYSIKLSNPGFDTGIPAVSSMSNIGRNAPSGSRLPRVKAGEKYSFTAWIKTDGAGIGGKIGIRLLNDKGVQVGITESNIQAGVDWKEVTVTSVIPKDAVNIGLTIATSGGGTAWFDDFKLVKM